MFRELKSGIFEKLAFFRGQQSQDIWKRLRRIVRFSREKGLGKAVDSNWCLNTLGIDYGFEHALCESTMYLWKEVAMELKLESG